jgi:predicted membrane protein DUF2207
VPRADAQPPSSAIERFAVTLEVNSDATLRVREAITIDFRGSHQVFFRTIPVGYERRGVDVVLRVSEIHVFDENVAPLKTEVTDLGRAIRIRADVPGAQNATRTIIITYRVRRALIDVDGHEELYWNVTGRDWDVPIRQVEAIVSSPPGILLDRIDSTAYTGSPGAAGSDYAEERADSFLTFRTMRPLRPREGLIIVVGWPPGAIRGPGLMQRAWWLLGDDWPLGLPLLALVGLLLVRRLYGRDGDGAPGIKPETQPPEGMLPAVGGILVSEKAAPRDVVATLVDLAVRGSIRIEALESALGEMDWVLHLLKPLADNSELRPLERSLLSRLFGSDGSLGKRRLAEIRRDYDNVFPPIRDEMYRGMVGDGLLPSSPERARSLWLFSGLGLVGLAGFILAGGAGHLVRLPRVVGAGLGVAGLIVAAFSPQMPRKTLRGVEATARVKGFREFLERASTDELRRLPPDTMHKWLAWAIALGVSERWIHGFHGLTVTGPIWFRGPASFDLGAFDRSLQRFASSMEQAILSSRRGRGETSWASPGAGRGAEGGTF